MHVQNATSFDVEVASDDMGRQGSGPKKESEARIQLKVAYDHLE